MVEHNDVDMDAPLHWLIVGGTPRSGTTALLNSLNSHSEVALVPEWKSEKTFRGLNMLFDREASLRKKSWIGNINLHERPGAQVITNSFFDTIPKRQHRNAMLRYLFQRTFNKTPRLIGEKYPRYWIMNIEAIRQEVERLSIVHIVRRPSSVIRSYRHRAWLASQKQDMWRFGAVEDGFVHWLEGWTTLSEQFAAHPDDVFPAKYEAFFEGDAPFAPMLAFLGLAEQPLSPFVEGEKLVENEYLEEPKVATMLQDVFGDLEDDWSQPLAELMRRYPAAELQRRLSRHSSGAEKMMIALKKTARKLSAVAQRG